MASDSSTPIGTSDEIDLGWDDDSSSPPAGTQASSSAPAASLASVPEGAAAPQPIPSGPVRLAMPAGTAARPQAAAKQPVRSTTPSAMPSVKPAAEQPVRSTTPRPMLPAKLAAKARRSVARQQSTPPSSVRPVFVAPRPTPSSPSSELPSAVAARSEVTPASPVLPQAAQEPSTAPPAEAAPAIDLAPAIDVPVTEAPAAILASNTFETSLSPPSVPLEWREAGNDTLRPSHVDPPPEFSAGAFRNQTPWRALLAAAIVALAGVIWLVASSTSSEPDTVAALPPAPRTVTPSRAPAALPRAVRPPSTAEGTATPATSGDPSTLSGAADTVPVTVHVSPPNAVVFKSGQPLGTGEVTVNVVRGTTTTLVAQLLGYLPRTVVVDGTNKSVNIVLNRPESAPVTAAPAQKAAASSPKWKPDRTAPARVGEPSEGASNNAETSAGDVPSDSTRASGSKPSKPSPPASTGTAESDPISEVNPL
jgi:hypothetical protein